MAPWPQRDERWGGVLPWVILLGALIAVYIPVFADLAAVLWRGQQNAHGPLVLLIALWFLGYQIRRIAAEGGLVAKPNPRLGWAVLGLGLIMYVLGRSQTVYILEAGSLIPVLLGGILILFGTAVARGLWFFFFFLLFMLPLPGALVDILTLPMKMAVSWGAEQVLYNFGYPIARRGVVLAIGPYQLFVADACAGLNSLFTLEALGLLYLNVIRRESPWRNITLAALIVPIGYTANLIRVSILALITFYLGDIAGQGFLHRFSGLVLFVTALLLVVGVDGLLHQAARRNHWHAGT